MPSPEELQYEVAAKMPRSFETERLVIRSPHQEVAAKVNEAIVESAAELQPWMPWADPIPTIDDTKIHLTAAIERFDNGEDFLLHIFRKEDDLFVGGSGLHRADLAVPKFEIGYWCRTSCVGMGYITEAVRGITAVAFDALGARRVEIMMDSRNARSVAVAERSGYELEGVLRYDERARDGSLRDTNIYAVIRE